ncbi:MAG: VWA domain-containing protein [Candidatus Gracilibacteria bacterium]|nr:VWA domain-containing protein [Candidatus Gracilibacteria bacterium]
MFQILYPFLIAIIIPILGLIIFLYKKNNQTSHFGAFGDIEKIYKNNSMSYKKYYFLVFLISLGSVIIISQPTLQNTKENISKDGIDIMLVLDVSYSMLAEDIEPNRLDVAKNIIIDFIDTLKTDRLGLVIFAGKPFTSLPLNFDYNISKQILSNITVDTINQRVNGLQGTAIGDSIIFASDNFNNAEREKVMILLTDGTANVGIDPVKATEYINDGDNTIKIYSIGLGSKEDTFIEYQNSYGFTQKKAIGGIDEKILTEISKISGGKYFRATNKQSLEKIFLEISQLETSEIEVETIQEIKAFSNIFVQILIFLFLYLMFYKIRKKI